MSEVKLDAQSLREVMTTPFEGFYGLGALHHIERGLYKKRHIHIQRGHKVLAVAHLDSVCKPTHFWMNHKYLACPTIDNRLGAWVILHGLAAMGIETDILLCDDEEKGQSTAQDFVLPEGVEYNWMFSFDRTGTDVACYQYLDKEFTETLGAYGLIAARGSYSDIASLDHLGVRGINVGCGMYDYHSEASYCNLDELRLQLARFAAFYRAHHATRFEYVKPPHKPFSAFRNITYVNKAGEVLTPADAYVWAYHEYDYAAKEERLSERAIKRDIEKCDGILADFTLYGIGNPYFGGLTPSGWWLQHKISELDHDSHGLTCKACNWLFTYEDTLYSTTLMKSYCKQCFLEEMERAGFLNDDWFALATHGYNYTKGDTDNAASLTTYPMEIVDFADGAL